MASITWSGGTLANVWLGTPASRFNGFEPDVNPVGQLRELLADGDTRMWLYRSDYIAEFQIRDISNTSLALCLALKLHLMTGGVVSVAMEDLDDNVYANCGRAPGTTIERPKLDPATMRYSMTLALRNRDNAPLLARY